MVAVICKRPMVGTEAFGNRIIKTHMEQCVEATGEDVSQQWWEWM